jgi:hypothetical protein
MSNIGMRLIIHRSIPKCYKRRRKNDQERNGRQNTRTSIHKFTLIFSRRINLQIIASSNI